MKKKTVSVLLASAMVASMLMPASAIAGETEASTEAPTANVAGEDEHTLSVYAWDANFNIPALKAAEADYQKNVDPDFKLNVITQSASSDV